MAHEQSPVAPVQESAAVSGAADPVAPAATALRELVARAAALVRARLAEEEQRGYYINDEAIDLCDLAKSSHRGRGRHEVDPVDALLHAGVFEIENEWNENGADWAATEDDRVVAEIRAEILKRELGDELEAVAAQLVAAGDRDDGFDGDDLAEELDKHEDLDREQVLEGALHGTTYSWQGHFSARAPVGSISLHDELLPGLIALRITPAAFLAGLASLSADDLPFATAQEFIPERDSYLRDADPADAIAVAAAHAHAAAQDALDQGDSRRALLHHFEATLATAGRAWQLAHGDPIVFAGPPAVDPAALCRALFLNYDGKPSPLDGSTEVSIAVRLEGDYIENVSRAVARSLEGPTSSVRLEVRSGTLFCDNDPDRSVPITGGIRVGMTELRLGDDNVQSMCDRRREDVVVPADALGAEVRLYEIYLAALEARRLAAARAGDHQCRPYAEDVRSLPWDRPRMQALLAELDERFLPDPKSTLYRAFAKELRAARRARGTGAAYGQQLLVVLADRSDLARARDEALALIARGADLTIRSPGGSAAAHYAGGLLDPTLLRALGAAGADLNVTVNQGGTAETAFHLALRAAEQKWSRFAPAPGDDTDLAIKECFDVLLEAGATLPATPYFESTAAPLGDRNVLATLGLITGPALLRRFIDRSEVPQAQLDEALVHAALDGVAPVVAALLDAGASPNVRWPKPSAPPLDAQVRSRFDPATGGSSHPRDGAPPAQACADITHALAAARARAAAKAALQAPRAAALTSP